VIWKSEEEQAKLLDYLTRAYRLKTGITSRRRDGTDRKAYQTRIDVFMLIVNDRRDSSTREAGIGSDASPSLPSLFRETT
jgi:hypothetical protein